MPAATAIEGSDTLGNIARTIPLRAARRCAALGLARVAHRRRASRAGCAARRLRPDGGGVARQGLGHRALGADGPRPRPAVPGVSRRLSRGADREFERRIGRRTLGNKAASGTAIIDELGTGAHDDRQARSSTRRPTACSRSPRTRKSCRCPSCIAFCEIAYELVGARPGRRARHRAAVRRRAGRVHAHREPPRLRADAVRADAARSC